MSSYLCTVDLQAIDKQDPCLSIGFLCKFSGHATALLLVSNRPVCNCPHLSCFQLSCQQVMLYVPQGHEKNIALQVVLGVLAAQDVPHPSGQTEMASLSQRSRLPCQSWKVATHLLLPLARLPVKRRKRWLRNSKTSSRLVPQGLLQLVAQQSGLMTSTNL